VYSAEREMEQHKIAFKAVEGREVSLSPTINEKYLGKEKGNLIHMPGSEVHANVVDHDFGINLPGLRLQRHTEYCQWQEHHHDECDKCPDGEDEQGKTKYRDCNCRRTFTYTKTWRTHRINSLLFDQPGAHHNPQRDPFPSWTVNSGDAKTVPSDIHLPAEMLDGNRLLGATRYLDFAPNGIRPAPGMFERIATRYFGYHDTTLYADMSELKDLQYSPAGRENFRFVGRGYFFSPYEVSHLEQLTKTFVQFMEGSLLSWQIGDIMPSCTAGDLRSYYSVLAPTQVSVVGQLVEGGGMFSKHLSLIPYKTPNSDWAVGMVHEGNSGFAAMKEADIWK